MATTEELVKKAFDEIGDQISSSTRDLLNSIPRLERRVRELEGEENAKEAEKPRKADIPEKEPMSIADEPTDSIGDWGDDVVQDEEKDASHVEKIQKSQGKNARSKDAEK